MDSGKLSAVSRSVCETVGVWPFKSLRAYLLNGSVPFSLDFFSVHRDRAYRFNCLRFWMESNLEHGVFFVYEKFKMFKWPFPPFFEFIFIFPLLTISLSFRYIVAISFVRKTSNSDYLSLKLFGVHCPQWRSVLRNYASDILTNRTIIKVLIQVTWFCEQKCDKWESMT